MGKFGYKPPTLVDGGDFLDTSPMGGNGLPLMSLAGGGLGGAGYCVAMGASVTDPSRMGICAVIGAGTGFLINYGSQNYGGGVLPSSSRSSPTMTVAYSAAYGFVGAAIAGFFM
jgi:hypothetical protein